MEKIRIGVIFGGNSREREVSFAGGRTVYDNLDKSIFEPIPVFVDSFGNLVLLSWEFIYKGSIRDFYPPAEFLTPSTHEFQVYAESLGDADKAEQIQLIHKIGNKVDIAALGQLIDVAFLCLHGTNGEDGRIQGLLEYYKIPYTGSGIIASSIGMNKAIQKKLMKAAGFEVPNFTIIERSEWINQSDKSVIFEKIKSEVALPFVIKSANQGSSIGVNALQENDLIRFVECVNRSLFIRTITKVEWDNKSFDNKVAYVRELADIREGIGMPIRLSSRVFYHPEELLSVLMDLFAEGDTELMLQSVDSESTVVIESFISGKEFSCIVIEDENGNPVALPPTEIRKGKELFDYRSKYLPGLSRKITPIQVEDHLINLIRKRCEDLFSALHFDVYARIDGFITADGRIILNDPNTTSGMMPSSFFFHQAAEIGLNPSQFITFIIYTSLKCRKVDFKSYGNLDATILKLNKKIQASHSNKVTRLRAAVILGGYSSERHISVESGRNIYEKLASSDKYEVLPIFLTGGTDDYQLYTLPINILLKDNADDIKEKIQNFYTHPIIFDIIERCGTITNQFGSSKNLESPTQISFQELSELSDVVFIALHGRPGEDGSLQRELTKVGLPYNGSGPDSSKITIDKYQTNSILRKHGFKVANHAMVFQDAYVKDKTKFFDDIYSEFKLPFIAKPVDDGCSSAVKIIRSKEELEAYVELTFRNTQELDKRIANFLKIKEKEEFPRKKSILIESLITAEGAARFIEITGGMLTSYDEKGKLIYEVFEASEALSEGDVLSLEEKFLAGQGQNITPARYSSDATANRMISTQVKVEFERVAKLLNIEGYARIDAFVRIYDIHKVETIFIEVNSLPGMTPATCIFHQAAIAQFKPYEFIDRILDFGIKRNNKTTIST